MPGLPSVAASSQGWASVGSMWSTSLNEAWLPEWKIGSTGGFTVPCSPSSSGYIFSSSGDGTTGSGNSFYALGRAVRVVQGASTIYGNVATASVAAGVTTVGLSSSLATAALSTATAFTSVAVGTESGHSLPGSSGLSSSLAHLGDGTWGALTTVAHGPSSHNDRTRRMYIPAPAFAATYGTPTLGGNPSAGNMETAAWFLDAAAVAEAVGTSFMVPTEWASGAMTFIVHYFMESATLGNVVIRTRALARAAGESVDVAADVNVNDTDAVPGTAELTERHTVSVTLTVAANEWVQIDISRMGSDASDTAAGDMGFLGLEIQFTADQ